jgi:hypothetical protein
MGKYLVELWLDGYDSEEEREAAELSFIEESLDFSASSVKVTKIEEEKA